MSRLIRISHRDTEDWSLPAPSVTAPVFPYLTHPCSRGFRDLRTSLLLDAAMTCPDGLKHAELTNFDGSSYPDPVRQAVDLVIGQCDAAAGPVVVSVYLGIAGARAVNTDETSEGGILGRTKFRIGGTPDGLPLRLCDFPIHQGAVCPVEIGVIQAQKPVVA